MLLSKVSFGFLFLLSLEAAVVAMPACPVVPAGGCSVCGDGQCVGNPGKIFAGLPGSDPISCGDLQLLGYSGGLTSGQCSLFVGSGGLIPQCGCGDGSPQPIPDPPPSFRLDVALPCDFGPNALTDFYDKEIPRTCIEVPTGDTTISRCYYTYIPDSCANSDRTVPLVLDLHGFSWCPLLSSVTTGWLPKAEEECFVLVWPSGEKRDNSYLTSCYNLLGLARDDVDPTNEVLTQACCCRDTTGVFIPTGLDDQDFIKATIDHVLETFEDANSEATSLSLDENRVYLAGYSNGCAASLAVAATYSDTIAAVACYAGFITTPFGPGYNPVPIWLVHGQEDLIVPYNGRSTDIPPLGPQGYWSFPQSVDYLAAKNECQDESVESISDANGVVGQVVRKTNCRNGAVVEGVTLTDSGHLPYLTPFPVQPSFGGSVTTIDTTDLAWDFLKDKVRCATPDDDEGPGLVCVDDSSLPTDACSICGTGRCVSNPGVVFQRPGLAAYACNFWQAIGYAGGLPLGQNGQCAFYRAAVSNVCGCAEGATVSPTSRPTLCTKKIKDAKTKSAKQYKSKSVKGA